MSTSSGWYPDPSGRFEQRFYDGLTWTHQVASGGHRYTDSSAIATPVFGFATTAPIQVQVVSGTNGLATAGLVLGIVGLLISLTILFFFIAFPLAFLAFVFGLIGRSRAKQVQGNGWGKAIAAAILGAIGLAISTISFIAIVAVVNEAADEASDQLASIVGASGQWDVTAVKVTDPATLPSFRPTTGSHLVAVEVRAINRNETLQTSTPSLFHLEDAAGHRFNQCICTDLGTRLKTPLGGVAPGEAITGVLWFAVADGAKPTVLVLKQDLTDRTAIRIPLI